MTFWYWLFAGFTGLVAVVAMFFWIAGPERIWELFGPADLGDIEFETLQRRSTPNDALICPSSLCPAASDLLAPVYPVDLDDLRKAMRKALMSERRLTLVEVRDSPPTDRYVQRSEKLHFPDTIVIRYVELGPSRSTVAIYSRSQLGRKDLGVNLARIERWIRKLAGEIKKVTMKTNA